MELRTQAHRSGTNKQSTPKASSSPTTAAPKTTPNSTPEKATPSTGTDTEERRTQQAHPHQKHRKEKQRRARRSHHRDNPRWSHFITLIVFYILLNNNAPTTAPKHYLTCKKPTSPTLGQANLPPRADPPRRSKYSPPKPSRSVSPTGSYFAGESHPRTRSSFTPNTACEEKATDTQ